VLGESLGAEEFGQFFNGKAMFLDTDRTFYGPQIRRMHYWGFFRLENWINIYKSSKLGTPGNLEGDGTYLGGVYVLGPGNQGVVYEHREGTWGDNVNTTDVLEAVEKMVDRR